ncbi:MAG: ABC transporter permease, partial [Candidatus Paceibacterota bacterium]
MSNMHISESIKIALSNFKRHKIRTGLSMLGIIIGILAVSMILSLGRGVKGYVNEQVTSFGTNLVTVATQVPGKGAMGSLTSMVKGTTITTLKQEDFEAIEKGFNFVEGQTCYTFSQVWTTYQGKENNAYLFAATPEYINIDQQAKIKTGRFYNEREEKANQKVVVLGTTAKENLFGGKSALGKTIKIREKGFKVIGVMEERGQMGTFNYDNMIATPLSTAQNTILGIDYVNEGMIKVKPETNMSLATQRITSLM